MHLLFSDRKAEAPSKALSLLYQPSLFSSPPTQEILEINPCLIDFWEPETSSSYSGQNYTSYCFRKES